MAVINSTVWINLLLVLYLVPDKVVNSDILHLVSSHISMDFAGLARELGLSDCDIDTAKYNFNLQGPREIAYQLLREWHERCGRDATVEVLARALLKVKRPDIALKLAEPEPSDS